MTDILTDVRQATPLWLTECLQKHGLLSSGAAVDVQVSASRQTNVSRVYHLAVQYSGATAGPKRLFLKLPNPETFWVGKEVEFYRVGACVAGQTGG